MDTDKNQQTSEDERTAPVTNVSNEATTIPEVAIAQETTVEEKDPDVETFEDKPISQLFPEELTGWKG